MTPATTNLFFRNDTILGVCEALGRDFGFHPNLLRVILACAVFFAPAAVIGGYLALGAVVALARWIAPDERIPAPAAPVEVHQLIEAGIEEVQLAA